MKDIIINGHSYSNVIEDSQNIAYGQTSVKNQLDTNTANISAINSNLTMSYGGQSIPFRPAIDGEGNYGYLKADDSFAPFKYGDTADLLWTNPNPTVAFPAQTVSLDLSQYVGVLIITKENEISDYFPRNANFVPKNSNYTQLTATTEGSYSTSIRKVKYDSAGIIFYRGVVWDGYNSGMAREGACIPLYIFGVKRFYSIDDYIMGTEV